MSRYVTAPTADHDVVIRDVTVVDPLDGTATAGQDVRFTGATIASVAATSQTGTAAGQQVVDGRGRFLVPGFADMHAHPLNSPDDVDGAYALMLANGVVGFRQMSGSPALLAARAAGALPAPLGAPALLATPGDLLTPVNASTAEAAVATVRDQHAQGADFVKAALVGRDAFLAALAEAGRLGVPLAGHLPNDVDPREASRGGMRAIEHLGPGATVFAATSSREAEVRSAVGAARTPKIPTVRLPGMDRVIGRVIRGIVVNPATRTSDSSARALTLADDTFDEEAAQELAALFVEHETWQCPTLVRLHTQQFPNAPEHRHDDRRRYIAPGELRSWDRSGRKFAGLPSATRDALESHWAAQLRLVGLLAAAGVPMLAGTDADGAAGVIPGFALHDEFGYLADAGLGPLQILRTATSDAARFLGLETETGRLAPGSRADAVLLAADPMASHTALGRIDGVVRAGSFWDRSALDGILERVAGAPGAR
ncbi:hypothetical protein BIV03_10705 [Curtobacterium sp. MCBA15_016]|uniref:amidohydrolase family protein n=1 Tax=Curtobacterium sp. MCBA15_016 TaxID=1898740 RepID=UPI0008DE0A13|nr:amidohydrolase family protein [Curtobacterium sp. MCBA15_016]OII24283.1 hypothetical protein BIV03_10705 [Curtobacterium sp. MCBA15_016]